MSWFNGVFGVLKPSTWNSRTVVDHVQLCAAGALHNRNMDDVPKRRRRELLPKLGHGGTLVSLFVVVVVFFFKIGRIWQCVVYCQDSLASGVLVLGAGSGTKQLEKYLSCSKVT